MGITRGTCTVCQTYYHVSHPNKSKSWWNDIDDRIIECKVRFESEGLAKANQVGSSIWA